jgi:hypothetical protein
MMTIHDRLRNALAALGMPNPADGDISPAYLRGYQAGLDSARWAVDVDERVYVRAARLADLADWTESELRAAHGDR